jgi:hypothetical protein
MLELRFKERELRDRCCDMASMTRSWGAEAAERLALRLQQLAAMESVDDVSFLPCDTSKDGEGHIHVAVSVGLTVVVSEVAENAVRGEYMMAVLIVEDIVESGKKR